MDYSGELAGNCVYCLLVGGDLQLDHAMIGRGELLCRAGFDLRVILPQLLP